MGAPKSTGGGWEKRDQGPGEINECFHNKKIMGPRWMRVAREGEEWDLGFPLFL